MNHNFKLPDSWISIRTIDAHTEGEPLRIIYEGFPELKGDTILEKRQYCMTNFDHIRKALMWEPRGHADMYGAIITSPERENSDFGVLFTHNEGYSTMCGHGILGLTKVLLQSGMIKKVSPKTELNIDTPAGLVRSWGLIQDDKIIKTYFNNVSSYVEALDVTVEIPSLGKINYDLAFGGAYYAFVNVEQLGIDLVPDNYLQLIETGMAIKKGVMESRELSHPFSPDLNFLYGTIFTGPAKNPDNHSRNVCIFAEGEVDRSPTGTGVSARAAIHYALGEIALNQPITIESILGTTFQVTAVSKTTFGSYSAVVPRVQGNAHITGIHEFVIDPDDPLREGFILR